MIARARELALILVVIVLVVMVIYLWEQIRDVLRRLMDWMKGLLPDPGTTLFGGGGSSWSGPADSSRDAFRAVCQQRTGDEFGVWLPLEGRGQCSDGSWWPDAPPA